MTDPIPPRPLTRLAAFAFAALLACAPAAHAQRVFVLTSDFTSGALARVTPATWAVNDVVNTIHSDARARVVRETLYVVNRFGADNVQMVNPANNATIRQFSTGNGSNPSDIAVLSSRCAYVSRYESTDLWVVDPATGAHTGTVSLAALADADGVPEMDRITVYGHYAFVSLQRVDRNAGFQPTDTALVAVVDTRADTLVDCDTATPGVQAIRLPRTNPATDFVREPSGMLLIGCVGRYGQLDGAVVRVDPVALAPASVVISEATLGGDLGDLAWHSPTRAWAVISDASFNASVVRFDPAAGTLDGTLYAPGGFSVPDIGLDGAGRLWVCDNSFAAPGLRAYDAASEALLHAPLTFALPPVAVAFGLAPALADAPARPASALALSPPSSQPARGAVRFVLTLAAAGEARVEVLDAAGRRARVLAHGPRGAGAHTVEWDLRDDSGAAVAPGLYWLRAAAGDRFVTQRVVVVR